VKAPGRLPRGATQEGVERSGVAPARRSGRGPAQGTELTEAASLARTSETRDGQAADQNCLSMLILPRSTNASGRQIDQTRSRTESDEAIGHRP
jgi:hypothetical protein